MTTITRTAIAAPSFADRFRALVDTVKAAQARRAVYKRTLNELHSLSARDRGDLGISRNNLRAIAYQAAYEGETRLNGRA